MDIEVKHTGQHSTFFLSRHEWEQSRILPNYWFYLVTSTEAIRPSIEVLAADKLALRHLIPVQYLVQLSYR